MRLFLIGWAGVFEELVDVASELKKRGHEIVYWSRFNGMPVDASRFPGTIFHDHFDALARVPASGIDPDEFEPPGEDLIQCMFETESLVLSMMNKKFEWMAVNERKHVYYEFLRYWNGVVQKFKPDAIIFSAVPHTVYDFVIYSLAREFGIKTLFFDFSLISDRIVAMSDYKAGPIGIAEELERSMAKKPALSDVGLDLREYYMSQIDRGRDPTPIYVKQDRRVYRGTGFLKLKFQVITANIKNFRIFERAWNFVFKKMWRNLRAEYTNIQSVPSFEKNFIYAPLSYQPEGSTSPFGGIFVEQPFMLEILSSAMPDDWLIYVKEHPMQWPRRGTGFFSYRYDGYYRRIAKLKNVRLIPIETDTYTLLKKSQAVAVVSGTAGWEAVLRQKPALVFGYPWYQQCPGVFRVHDAASARRAIEKISAGFFPSEEDIVAYLSSFDRISFHGYLDEYGRQISTISPRENTMNLAEAIEKEITKV